MGTLNPAIRTIQYGKKDLKEVIIYPLSIKDQFLLTDLITKIVQGLAENTGAAVNDLSFVKAITDALEANLSQVLVIVAEVSAEEADEIIGNMTNPQLADLVESIWEADFEPMLKKGMNLFDRAKSMFNSRRLSQNSSSSTLSTTSDTSTEKVSETEESPLPN